MSPSVRGSELPLLFSWDYSVFCNKSMLPYELLVTRWTPTFLIILFLFLYFLTSPCSPMMFLTLESCKSTCSIDLYDTWPTAYWFFVLFRASSNDPISWNMGVFSAKSSSILSSRPSSLSFSVASLCFGSTLMESAFSITSLWFLMRGICDPLLLLKLRASPG